MSKAIDKHATRSGWASHPKLIERARIVLSVSLAKRPPGEIVRIIMDWLDDAELHEFCHRYLDDDDLETIYRR